MTPGAGPQPPGGWFGGRSPGGEPFGPGAPLPGVRWGEPLPSAAERRWQIPSLLVRRRRVEAEGLRQSAEALRRQILELEQVRAQMTVDPPGPVPARLAAGRSAGAFWSPVPVLGFRMWTLSSLGARGAVRVWEEPGLVAHCPAGRGRPTTPRAVAAASMPLRTPGRCGRSPGERGPAASTDWWPSAAR